METECIVYTGSKVTGGYGKQKYKGKQWRAHRLAWFKAFGPIPDGLLVCHKCDVPACINVEHLFLGTTKDNIADKVAKGRAYSGNKVGINNGNSKLTEEDILDIRDDPRKQKDIAKDYGVGQVMISLIKRRKSWAHVKERGSGN